MRSTTNHPGGAQSFDQIWEAILLRAEALRLRPRDQLPSVRELAEYISVKPTLVRDALLQAQAKGAVRIVPRVGAFLQTSPTAARAAVRSPEEIAGAALKSALGPERQNVLHLLDARRMLEVELVGRAAERRRLEELLPARRLLEALLQLDPGAPRPQYIELDLKFHAELVRLAGNPILAAMYRAVIELLLPHLDDVMADIPPDNEMRIASDRLHASIYAAVADGDVARARGEMHDHLSTTYNYLLRILETPP